MSYKYFIAKTKKGCEFMHSKKDAFYTSAASRFLFCDMLNKKRYNLKDDELYHIYEVDYMSQFYIDKVIKKSKTRVFITSI